MESNKNIEEECVKREKAAYKRSSEAVMELFYVLRDIGGTPNLKDLVKLAKRIKNNK